MPQDTYYDPSAEQTFSPLGPIRPGPTAAALGVEVRGPDAARLLRDAMEPQAVFADPEGAAQRFLSVWNTLSPRAKANMRHYLESFERVAADAAAAQPTPQELAALQAVSGESGAAADIGNVLGGFVGAGAGWANLLGVLPETLGVDNASRWLTERIYGPGVETTPEAQQRVRQFVQGWLEKQRPGKLGALGPAQAGAGALGTLFTKGKEGGEEVEERERLAASAIQKLSAWEAYGVPAPAKVPAGLAEQYGVSRQGVAQRFRPSEGAAGVLEGASGLAGFMAGARGVGGVLGKTPLKLLHGAGLPGRATLSAAEFGLTGAAMEKDPSEFIPQAVFGGALPVAGAAITKLGGKLQSRTLRRAAGREQRALSGAPGAQKRARVFERIQPSVSEAGLAERMAKGGAPALTPFERWKMSFGSGLQQLGGAQAEAKGLGARGLRGEAARFAGRTAAETAALGAGAGAAAAVHGENVLEAALDPAHLLLGALFGARAKRPGERSQVAGARSATRREATGAAGEPLGERGVRGPLPQAPRRMPGEPRSEFRARRAVEAAKPMRERIREQQPSFAQLSGEDLGVVSRELRRKRELGPKWIPSDEYASILKRTVGGKGFAPTSLERYFEIDEPRRRPIPGAERLARREEPLTAAEREKLTRADFEAAVGSYVALMRRQPLPSETAAAPVEPGPEPRSARRGGALTVLPSQPLPAPESLLRAPGGPEASLMRRFGPPQPAERRLPASEVVLGEKADVSAREVAGLLVRAEQAERRRMPGLAAKLEAVAVRKSERAVEEMAKEPVAAPSVERTRAPADPGADPYPRTKEGVAITEFRYTQRMEAWAKGKGDQEVFEGMVRMRGGIELARGKAGLEQGEIGKHWVQAWERLGRDPAELRRQVEAFHQRVEPYRAHMREVVGGMTEAHPNLQGGDSAQRLSEFLAQARASADLGGTQLTNSMQRIKRALAEARNVWPADLTTGQRSKRAENQVREAMERSEMLDVAEVLQGLAANPRAVDAKAKTFSEPVTLDAAASGKWNWDSIAAEITRPGIPAAKVSAGEAAAAGLGKAGAKEGMSGRGKRDEQARLIFAVASGGRVADVLRAHGVAAEIGSVGRGQKILLQRMVKLGIAEPVPGTRDHRLTEQGMEVLSDFRAWQRSSGETWEWAKSQPTWFASPHQTFTFRCLSHCHLDVGVRDKKAGHGLFKALRTWGDPGAGLFSWLTHEVGTTYPASKRGSLLRQIMWRTAEFLPQSTPSIMANTHRQWGEVARRTREIGQIFGKELMDPKKRFFLMSEEQFAKDPVGKRLIEISEAVEGRGVPAREDDRIRVAHVQRYLETMRKEVNAFKYGALGRGAERALQEGSSMEVTGDADLRSLTIELVRQRAKDGSDAPLGPQAVTYLMENPRLVLEALAAKNELMPGDSRRVGTWKGEKESAELVVHGYGLRDYAPHMWYGQTEGPSADPSLKGRLKKLFGLEPVKESPGENVEAHYGAMVQDAASFLPGDRRRRFFRHMMERRADEGGYVKDIAFTLDWYTRSAHKKFLHDENWRLAQDELYGEWKEFVPKGMDARDALKEAFENAPSKSHLAENFIGHEHVGQFVIETRGRIPSAKDPEKHHHAYKEGGVYRWVRKHVELDKDGNFLFAIMHPVNARSTSDAFTVKVTPENYAEMQLMRRQGGLSQFMTEPDHRLIKDRVRRMARGRKIFTGDEDWHYREGPLGQAEEVASRFMGAFGSMFYQQQLGGFVNAPAAMTNYVEAVWVRNMATLGTRAHIDGLKQMRGFHTLAGDAKEWVKGRGEGLSEWEIWERLVDKYPHLPFSKAFNQYVRESGHDLSGVYESDHLAWIRDRSSWLERIFPERAWEQTTKASMHMFMASEMFARFHLWFGASHSFQARYSKESGIPLWNNPQDGHWYTAVTNRPSRQRSGTREDPHEVSGTDYAWHTIDRTHYTYQRALHPGLMNLPGWPMFGHLATYGTNTLFQSMRNAASVARVLYSAGIKREKPRGLDLVNANRGVKEWLALTGLVAALHEVFGMDLSYWKGYHPGEVADMAGVTAPGLASLPQWVRLFPGAAPDFQTLPVQFLKEGATSVFSGLEQVRMGRNVGDVAQTEAHAFRRSQTWLPSNAFEGVYGPLGDALAFTFPRGPGRWLEYAAAIEEPEGMLNFGPEDRPRVAGKTWPMPTLGIESPVGPARARLFLPGAPSRWTQGWRDRTQSRTEEAIVKRVKEEQLARWFDRDTPDEERREMMRDASAMGYDLLEAAKRRARSHGVPRHLRGYQEGTLERQVKRAAEQIEGMTRAERVQVHRAVWGLKAPFHPGFVSSRSSRDKVQKLLAMEGGADLLRSYLKAQGWSR